MTLPPPIERAYGHVLRVLTLGRGVAWHVDGTTTLRIDPRCRWIRNPSYEAAVVEYLRARIRPGDTCVDVGAHVGYYALQMALWTAPDGTVVAFEPNPLARDVLETNVRLNGLGDRIRVEPSAVADAPGTASLFHGAETTGLSRIHAPNPEADPGRAVQVPVVTLDAFCAQAAIDPAWILVDTEGLELQVLHGARRLLTQSRAGVVVEMHPDLWNDREATAKGIDALARESGRSVVALTGQTDALGGYGTIALARIPHP